MDVASPLDLKSSFPRLEVGGFHRSPGFAGLEVHGFRRSPGFAGLEVQGFRLKPQTLSGFYLSALDC